MIALSGVGYDVGRPLLSDIDLVFEAGRMAALSGSSGSGKTTLLSVAGGLLEPTRGTATYAGEPTWLGTGDPGPEISFVLQVYGLVPVLSARENVSVALRARGAAPEDADARAEAALAELHIGDLGDRTGRGAVGWAAAAGRGRAGSGRGRGRDPRRRAHERARRHHRGARAAPPAGEGGRRCRGRRGHPRPGCRGPVRRPPPVGGRAPGRPAHQALMRLLRAVRAHAGPVLLLVATTVLSVASFVVSTAAAGDDARRPVLVPARGPRPARGGGAVRRPGPPPPGRAGPGPAARGVRAVPGDGRGGGVGRGGAGRRGRRPGCRRHRGPAVARVLGPAGPDRSRRAGSGRPPDRRAGGRRGGRGGRGRSRAAATSRSGDAPGPDRVRPPRSWGWSARSRWS